MSVAVLRAGLLTTLQDRGRFGHAALGVGCAGPMDAVCHRLANALAGNADGAAALEIALAGPCLRFERDAVVAVAGAELPLHLDGRAVDAWRPFAVGAGQVLDVGRARRGAYAYLAVSGGFAAAPVLGSRSVDVNARLGPLGGRALAAGDVLACGAPALRLRRRAHWSLDPRPWFDAEPARPIRLMPGTHRDALAPAARAALFGAEFRVGAGSRVGVRLAGAPLALQAPVEIVSEPAAFGTLQLPPGGEPIALMAEHPVTGGYPRIGQVAAVDLPRLAQRAPGAGVRFRPCDPDDAQTRYLARERELARLTEAIAMRLFS
jgi:antagonist of KipI